MNQTGEGIRSMSELTITKEDIATLRGGYPENCSWCEKPTPPEFLEPEEAGEWVCVRCLWTDEVKDLRGVVKVLIEVIDECIEDPGYMPAKNWHWFNYARQVVKHGR